MTTPTIEEFEKLLEAYSWASYRNWNDEHIDVAKAPVINAFYALTERITELEAMLARLQWHGRESRYYAEICPICDANNEYGRGHEDGCALAALLPIDE